MWTVRSVAPAILAAALLAASMAASPGADRLRRPILAPDRTPLNADMVMHYAAVMLTQRSALLGSTPPFPQRLSVPAQTRWRWRADDGSVVQRVGEGQFRLTVGDCVARLCTDIDCRLGLWPSLFCTDGRERRMSAPDLSTVTVDEQVFRRSLPEVAESEIGEELPAE